MQKKWLMYCEESGDKCIPWVEGSSHYYIVTAILIPEEKAPLLKAVIEKQKRNVLRMSAPLEWKKLKNHTKRDDKIISRFLRKIEEEVPDILISQVICNKAETTGLGLTERTTFMNYLYGLMFKRISWFLKATNSYATLMIDRNTDKFAQESLKNYISDVSTYQTGDFPRHSKPKWMNPEEDPILGLSDFLSGISLRALTDYHQNVSEGCKSCNHDLCIYECDTSNFTYKRSFNYIINWCESEETKPKWHWKGLIYHPYVYKDNYKHLFLPK